MNFEKLVKKDNKIQRFCIAMALIDNFINNRSVYLFFINKTCYFKYY